MTEWDDPIEELARDLRQGVGSELWAEAEATEFDTNIGRLRRLDLADVARSAMHRGDIVSLVTATATITGIPVFTGRDYLVVQTPSEIVDAPFERVLIKVEAQPAGGHTTRGGAITFRARLGEYEQTGETVTIIAADTGVELTGRIAVVATDHCVVEDLDGGRTHVPISQVSMVVRPRPDR